MQNSKHSLIECKQSMLHAQSCPALCDRMDTAHQAHLSMGFPRQEYWSGLPFPSSGDLSNSGIKPVSPALQTDSLLSESPGKPKQKTINTNLFMLSITLG